MLVQLRNIAQILIGSYERPGTTGDVLCIQSSHFTPEEELLPHVFSSRIHRYKGIERHLLAPGDILITAKGIRNTSYLYPPSIGPAVASSMFLVLMPDQSKVLPSYLVAYLNTAQTQRLLGMHSGGSSIPSISKGTLEEIEIPLPDMSRQQEIMKIYSLWLHERKLMRSLLLEKSKFYQHLLVQTAEQ